MTSDEMRELKAWIQIHVFGWKHSVEKLYPNRRGFSKDGDFVLECDTPDYPADPAAAMMVLEKCAMKIGSLETVSIFWDDGQWGVRMAHANQDWAIGDTIPLAICKFAKKLFS